MTTTIQSIDATTSALLVNGVEALRLTQGGVLLPSVNGGQLAGMRNKIINGGALIAQRGPVAINNNTVQGGCDRVYSTVTGTTATATAQQAVAPVAGLASTGYCSQIATINSTGTTLVQWATRVESLDSRGLSGKTVTFSGKVYQTSGATVSHVAKITKANAADNFGTNTVVATSAAFNVPSGVVTPFTFTTTLGATDGNTGLQFDVSASGLAAQSGTQWNYGDMQVEVGAIATPYEQRPMSLELAMCQRYYETGTICIIGNASGALLVGGYIKFAVTKRTAGSLIVANVTENVNLGTMAFAPLTIHGFRAYATATGAGSAYYTADFSINAEIS